MDLNGKVAFVTGGSGDIGGAISKALAASGANVVVSYAGDAGRADATIDAVRQLGGQGLAVQLDQRDPKSIDSCVDKVIGGFGRIDILVNNAAWNIGIPFPALDALTADIWDRVHEAGVRVGASASQDGPYRQHCVACRNSSWRQQHCLRREQGGIDPSHTLSGSCIGPRCECELRSAGIG
jgi:NAD(P)-dependent dehydrogenase (short-subunit alcohol dehydrogenase family)